jgi:hypothetical protein
MPEPFAADALHDSAMVWLHAGDHPADITSATGGARCRQTLKHAHDVAPEECPRRGDRPGHEQDAALTGPPWYRIEQSLIRAHRLCGHRVEKPEQQQAGSKSTDMGLPGDALVAARHADRPDAEQQVQAKPRQ